MPDTHSIIDIQNATVYRGDTLVFDRLSLSIRRGENTAIVGPNGAGKSTFLKMLSRELYPVYADDTHVRLFGRDRWSVWELRSHLGIISPDLQHDYAGDAVGIAVVLSGYYASINTWGHQRFNQAQRRRALQTMEQLGIDHLREKAYAAMSTGEQRRFLLARALINDPEALILDEPTTGLDLPATFHYLGLVRRLMREGRTVILVTHHLHEIPPEVSRAILLRSGRLMADGAKTGVITENNLTRLYGTPIRLLTANGYYQALPGEQQGPDSSQPDTHRPAVPASHTG